MTPTSTNQEDNNSHSSSSHNTIALLLIVSIITNIGSVYYFSKQSTKNFIEQYLAIEYEKSGWKENYELLNKIQLEQIKPYLEQYKAKNAGTPATNDTRPTEPAKPAQSPVKKSDRPSADLFIMSYCPFGLQAQKAFVPLIDKFKKFADIKVKFVHYTMHGIKEAQENIRQYCIREEQSDKYSAYAGCFVKAGESENCLKEAKINTNELNSCYDKKFNELGGEAKLGAQGNPEFAIDKDASQAAGVQGSPTLVINGAQVESSRTQAGYAKAICDAFADGKQPEVCKEKFSEEAYQSGFGMGAGNGAPSAGCGQ